MDKHFLINVPISWPQEAVTFEVIFLVITRNIT